MNGPHGAPIAQLPEGLYGHPDRTQTRPTVSDLGEDEALAASVLPHTYNSPTERFTTAG
jgi:hypothetical protein